MPGATTSWLSVLKWILFIYDDKHNQFCMLQRVRNTCACLLLGKPFLHFHEYEVKDIITHISVIQNYEWALSVYLDKDKGQYVSSSSIISYGTPQGNVLGPILFLIYINYLPNIFTNLKTIHLADDSTLCITGENTTNMIQTVNKDLETLYTWCLSNRLSINSDKTFYMIFTNKTYDNLPPHIYLDDNIRKKLINIQH